jgi:hypothetical protein
MPVIAEGVDYSAGRPSVAAMRQAGKTFVVRYVAAGAHAKEITVDEAAFWRAAGIDVCIVYESTAARALEGTVAGAADARAARSDVIAAGGPSDGGVIYFAVDVDTTSTAQRAAAVDYLIGAAGVLGWDQVGVYGEYELIDFVATHCDCRWYWQTYAWSHGQLHARAQLYQYRNGQTLGGVEVDLDRAYAANFGQWHYQPTPEDDMPSIDEIRQVVREEVGRSVALALYGDDRDDTKDAGTHPENLQAIVSQLRAQGVQIAAQQQILTRLAAGQGADPAAIEAAFESALRDVLGSLDNPPAAKA